MRQVLICISNEVKSGQALTIDAGVVWLDSDLDYFSIQGQKCVSLASVIAKDGGAVK